MPESIRLSAEAAAALVQRPGEPARVIPELNELLVRDTAWHADPREVAPELEPGYPHATWPAPATRFASIAERLDRATYDDLMRLARGGIGEPEQEP